MVHALLSLHCEPGGASGFEQVPVWLLQVPALWHWSEAEHLTGLLPSQRPAWHTSVCVQALPSAHLVPFGAMGSEQVPVLALQRPTEWHWSLAAQVTGFAPLQAPVWQVSLCVHALPSLHGAPSFFAGLEQTPVVVLHTPAVWH